ncbi:MAG: hypothetical protein ACT4PJ_00325 [Gemmatimonadaceae bacterium]
MSPQASTARELTRRLIAREVSAGDAPDAFAEAAFRASERVDRELSRWVGSTGSLALINRALAEASHQHPVLREMRLDTRSATGVEAVAESVRTHGAAVTADGLESFLVALVGLLGRLIGDDLATAVVEQSASNDPRGEGNFTGQRTGP